MAADPSVPSLPADADAESSIEAIIRFTNSLPDLNVPLPYPSSATVATLLSSIRHTRPALARRRLRLIHGGKVLGPSALISSFYRGSGAKATGKGKGKGKAVAGEDAEEDVDDGRVWIHCSVGDELTEQELAAEDAAQPSAQPPPTTLPQPLGFDRLLSAGFSAAEVAALRSQFNRLNPNVNAEDMRMVEERWIDESAGGAGAGVGGGEDGGYEDMWIGTVIGFFWPLSILLLREDGVCSKRRMMAIVGGLLVNVLFGLIRLSA